MSRVSQYLKGDFSFVLVTATSHVLDTAKQRLWRTSIIKMGINGHVSFSFLYFKLCL